MAKWRPVSQIWPSKAMLGLLAPDNITGQYPSKKQHFSSWDQVGPCCHIQVAERAMTLLTWPVYPWPYPCSKPWGQMTGLRFLENESETTRYRTHFDVVSRKPQSRFTGWTGYGILMVYAGYHARTMLYVVPCTCPLPALYRLCVRAQSCCHCPVWPFGQ